MDGDTQLKKVRVRGAVAEETTNVRMEMTAIAKALEVVKPGEAEPIVIYSDNRLVLDGMSGWLQKWITNGWRKADKKPVENRDLWERLVAASAGKTIEWRWVKSHIGHPYNEEVDKLARAQMEEARAAFYGFAA
jgi:ribonuclease HI